MPNDGLKSRDKSFDSPGEVRSVTENAITRGLDGEHDVKKELGDGTLVPASDTTCSNEQLLSLRT